MPHFRNLSVSEVLSIKYYSQAAGSGSPRAREWGQFRNLSVSEVLSIKYYFSGGASRRRKKDDVCDFLPGGASRRPVCHQTRRTTGISVPQRASMPLWFCPLAG